MTNEAKICLSPICKKKSQDGEKKKLDLAFVFMLQSFRDDDVKMGKPIIFGKKPTNLWIIKIGRNRWNPVSIFLLKIYVCATNA